MWFSGDLNRIYTHRYIRVHLAPHNPTNEGDEEMEVRNIREIIYRGKKLMNRKDHGGLCDGWGCCLLAVIVS